MNSDHSIEIDQEAGDFGSQSTPARQYQAQRSTSPAHSRPANLFELNKKNTVFWDIILNVLELSMFGVRTLVVSWFGALIFGWFFFCFIQSVFAYGKLSNPTLSASDRKSVLLKYRCLRYTNYVFLMLIWALMTLGFLILIFILPSYYQIQLFGVYILSNVIATLNFLVISALMVGHAVYTAKTNVNLDS